MFNDLRKKAKTPGAPADPASTAPATPPDKASEPGAPEGATAPEGDPTTPPSGAPTEPVKDKKVSPWKLVEEWKGKYAKLEKDYADSKASVVPEGDRKSITERMERAESRANELEDHIRYVDYSKSAEFRTKYQEPYEKAWGRAVSELKEITIDDGAGGERAVSHQDILDLVNLPLGKAREMADSIFGSFADDVMAHRKEIRQLYESQNSALEEAKKNGAERVRLSQEQFQKQNGEIRKFVTDTWTKENGEITKHEKFGKFFTPVEGDEEGNQRLDKGFKLVDQAFSANPLDPKLTPEQRALVVRQHAAVRNRAAAFGRLTHQLEQAEAKYAAVLKELEEYKKGEPPGTGGRQTPTEGGGTSVRESMMGALRKMAK